MKVAYKLWSKMLYLYLDECFCFVFQETTAIPSRKQKRKWVCQRLVCQKREFAARTSTVKFQDVKFKDPLFKHEN